MSRKVTKFPIPANLHRRETIEVELPAFLVRALEARVRKTNEGATEEERVDLSHLIELHLADSVSVADLAYLERELPGVSAAVSRWIADIE